MSKKKNKRDNTSADNNEVMEKDINETTKTAPNTEQEIEERELSEGNDESVTQEEVEELEVTIDKLNTELEDSKDKYLRLFSEFENYKRRTSKERLELISSANADLIGSLLPVVDDFQRALESFDGISSANDVKEGVELINQKLNKTLEQSGLKLMDTAVGTEFDPDIHEAITQIPAPEEKLKGKIVDTIEPGYFLGDKVVRFAKVVIGN